MRPIDELVQYLDGYLAANMWSAGANLIENLTVSRTDYQLRQTVPGALRGIIRGLLKTSVSFDRLPRVTARGANEIGIRIPGDGRHFLPTDVDFWDPIPDPTIRGEILIEVTAGIGSAGVRVDVDTNLSWVSNFMLTLAGGSRWVKRLFEGVAEVILSEVLENGVMDELGEVKAYRFDRTGDLQWSTGTGSRIELVLPNGGSVEPKAAGYIDILLIADGFDHSNINKFNDLAFEVANLFATMPPSPFSDFSTALRIWRMPLIVNYAGDPLQRAAVPFADRNGDVKMTFSNLARVAEIGLSAHETFGRHSILVFCSKVDGSVRANAPGPFVLLDYRYNPPSSPGDPRTAASILVHELAHTPLGRILADEYSGGGLGKDKEEEKEEENDFYRGPEPEAQNVSIGGPFALMKWQAWIPPGSSSLGVAGAYEHDEGIYRFQENCRMRTDTLGDFCPVCREQLTLGMLDWGHYAVGVRGGQGMVDLRVEYVRPWTETLDLHLVGVEDAHLQAFVGSRTLVRVTIVGSSVPKSWHGRWRIVEETYATHVVRELFGRGIEIWLGPNARIELSLTHIVEVGGILSGQHPVPGTWILLSFDRERRASSLDLSLPTDLIQSLPVGGMTRPVINPADGTLSYPEDLWVAARLGEVRNYSLQTTVEFHLEGPADFSLSKMSAPGSLNERRRWRIERMVPTGRYVWSARTAWDGLSSLWARAPRSQSGICFEIGAVRFDTDPKPPVAPFDLIVHEFVRQPGVPRGLAASSWHPNDKTVRFQFEIKPHNEAWTGRDLSETGYIARDLSRYDSVAITGQIPIDIRVSLFSTLVKWRVRARDPDGRESAWVEGRPFGFVAHPGLVDIRELDPRMFDPRGPIEIPLLYVGESSFPTGIAVDSEFVERWRHPG